MRPALVAEIKDEDAPLALGAPPPFGDGIRVVEPDGARGARRSRARAALRLVLRSRHLVRGGRHHRRRRAEAPLPDRRQRRGLFSFVHVDDAAAATAIAVERGAPGVYNVVDDEPAALRDWLPVYAEAIGAPPPRRVPVWLARLIAGKAARSWTSSPARRTPRPSARRLAAALELLAGGVPRGAALAEAPDRDQEERRARRTRAPLRWPPRA
jgi:hypothetical protein